MQGKYLDTETLCFVVSLVLQTLDLQHCVALMLFVNSVAENAVAARILMQDNDPKKVLEM